MKTFLQKTIIFFGIPVVFLLSLIVFFSFYLSQQKYILDSNVSEIYIGDSHIKMSVNDSLLTKGKNTGDFSEPFYFSYYKIKRILSDNPNIKKIYLGVSYHNLSNYYNGVIDGKSGYVARYFFVLPVNLQLKYLYNNVKNPLYYKGVIKYGILRNLLYKYTSFLGPYSNVLGAYWNEFKETSATIKDMDNRLKGQYFTNRKLNDFSLNQLYYIQEITDLCKDYHIDLILINTPLHPYYRNKLPREYVEKYKTIIKDGNLTLIDFSELLSEDDCFVPDGDHVSKKGATIMTMELKRIQNIRH